MIPQNHPLDSLKTQKRKAPDCRAATINIAPQRQSNNQEAATTKSLRSAIIHTIISSLPAAASHSDCPLPFSSRLSHNNVHHRRF
jgi:hypothetical protein